MGNVKITHFLLFETSFKIDKLKSIKRQPSTNNYNMSFLSKLELDGNTYNILECKYNFVQPIDTTGKPKGMPKGGEIISVSKAQGIPNY